MEYDLQIKIYQDKKLAQYLQKHSQWYKYLNRGAEYYKSFYDEYKKANREAQTQKITSSLDTLDTVNTIFKIIN